MQAAGQRTWEQGHPRPASTNEPLGGALAPSATVRPSQSPAPPAASAMAAKLMEDKLTCSICLSLYQDPVTLPCGHSFCAACIRSSRRCCEACPDCREPFSEGAGEPRRNVALSGVLEALHLDPPEPGPEPRTATRCPRHGRPLELFCRTQGHCVCSACTVHDCRLHELALLDVERREREVTLPGGAPLRRECRGQGRHELPGSRNPCLVLRLEGLSIRLG